MSMYGSIHTHFESRYDTGNDLTDMCKEFQKAGCKKVAVTEHGAFSSFEDLRDIAAKMEDFEIIPGVEGYFERNSAHMVLVAKNYEGYLSLCRIITESNRNMKGEKPIITLDNLRRNVSKGNLFCTTACIAGLFGHSLGLSRADAQKKIEKLKAELARENFSDIAAVEEEYQRLSDLSKQKTTQKRKNAEKAFKQYGNRKALENIEALERSIEEAKIALVENSEVYKENHKLFLSLSKKQKKLEELETELKKAPSVEKELRENKHLYHELVKIFGKKDFYFELQNHGLPAEETIYNGLIAFAKEVGHTSFIASNDIHIGCTKEDEEKYKKLLLRREIIKFTRFKDNRYTPIGDDDYEYYIKTNEELREELLKIIDDESIVDGAIANIEGALSECSIEFPKDVKYYPKFCEDEEAEFDRLIEEGIKLRFPNGIDEEHKKRIEYESGIIKKMGFVGYHLIVADYLKYARLVGYLPDNEIANAPLSIEELDKLLTERGIVRIGYNIGPGRGCAKAGTMVYTSNGTKKIEEIIPGDVVYDHTGKLCPVKKVWEYDVDEEMLQFTVFCGGKLTFTKDHKFLSASSIPETVRYKISGGYRYKDTAPETPFEWKPAEELNVGDWLIMPKLSLPQNKEKVVIDLAPYASSRFIAGENELYYYDTEPLIEKGVNIVTIAKAIGTTKAPVGKFFHETSKIKESTIEKIVAFLNEKGVSVDEWRSMRKKISVPRYIEFNDALAYIIGYYIADGWTHGDTCHFAYNSETETEYREILLRNLRKTIGDDIKISESLGYKGKKAISLNVNCSPFAKFLANVIPGKANSKTIPGFVMNSSKELLRGLLRGLFDGDGSYIEGSRAKYSTCNRNLAYQIKHILLSLGIATAVRRYERKNEKWNDEWTVSFTTCETATDIFPKLQPSRRTSRNNVISTDNDNIYMRIKYIDVVPYKGKVYDLAIDTPNEPSYCTDVCAVHNSGAGSLVCYVLGITDLDPLRYGLLFERFLNTERVTMPDIDSDFRTDVRERAVEYVKARYGEWNVCQIITKSYGAIKGNSRLAARYLGAKECFEKGLAPKKGKGIDVMKRWYDIGDAVAKAVETDKDGNEFINRDALTGDAELLVAEYAEKLDGVFTGYGQHAAGTIISGCNLTNLIPLMYNDKKHNFETQCTMAQAEAKGVLKMDFLGLENLNMITEVERLSKDARIQDITLRDDILADNTVYENIYQKGLTQGVFQFESDGMKSMLVDFKPECFEDLILLVSAYRPGPMDYLPEIIASKWYEKFNGDYAKYSAFIKKTYPFSKEEYREKKEKKLAYFYDEHGNVLNYVPHSITLKNAVLDEILKPTYGCPVYQEQIMQIFQAMAGYSLGGADIVRRYMSKKKTEALAKEKNAFIFGDEKRGIPGCIKLHGLTEEEADTLFEQMMPFAKYGFNKSHAAAYALVSFFTAWQKNYYPTIFYTVSLNHIAELSEIRPFVKEMQLFHVKLNAPSLLLSHALFTCEGNEIRYGLKFIKGLSEKEFMPLPDPMDFLYANAHIGLSTIEGYIRSGLFDEHCPNRQQLIKWFEDNGKKIEEISKAYDEIEILRDEGSENTKKIKGREEKIETLSAQLTPISFYREIPRNVVEDRRFELENLGTVFSYSDSVALLQKQSDNVTFKALEEGDAQVNAIVLSCVGPKKTKKSGNTYYEVTLRDCAGNEIVRRFDQPVTVLEGRFFLTSNEGKFFLNRVRNIKPLRIRTYFLRSADEQTVRALQSSNGNVNVRVYDNEFLTFQTSEKQIKELPENSGFYLDFSR